MMENAGEGRWKTQTNKGGDGEPKGETTSRWPEMCARRVSERRESERREKKRKNGCKKKREIEEEESLGVFWELLKNEWV